MDLDPRLEKYRLTDHPNFESPKDAEYGAFAFSPENLGAGSLTQKDEVITCIVDNGQAGEIDSRAFSTGWEHVSVSIQDRHHNFRLPTWTEMDKIKTLFWAPDETVVQFHPAEGERVNNHEAVLHLWRPVNGEFPTPPPETVGFADMSGIPGTAPAKP